MNQTTLIGQMTRVRTKARTARKTRMRRAEMAQTASGGHGKVHLDLQNDEKMMMIE